MGPDSGAGEPFVLAVARPPPGVSCPRLRVEEGLCFARAGC
jgi:hypothetical protein